MRIGLITIGQSPRHDVTSLIGKFLGLKVELVEKGALDDLSAEEVKRLRPKARDYVLVTKLRNGTCVKVARKHIMPRLQRCIEMLEDMDVDLNVLLCTGEFPRLKTRKPLIMPEALITNFIHCVKGGRIGVVVPEKEQIPHVGRKWKNKSVSVVVANANPYGDMKALEGTAAFLAEKGVDLIVLDCIGFTPKAREIFRRLTGKPVLLPLTFLGNMLKDLIGS